MIYDDRSSSTFCKLKQFFRGWGVGLGGKEVGNWM